MSCTRPLRAWESTHVWPSGKPKLVFHPAKAADPTLPIPLPCGKCDSCKMDRAKDWALRCVKEASLYEENIFLTLTYDAENLPPDLSLNKEHFTTFIRAVRDKYRDTHPKIRFFMCGEYGNPTPENNFIARPHYHALIFNFAFPDQKLEYRRADGDAVYSSESCTKLWGKGLIHIAAVNEKTAGYCARYTLKKTNSEDLKTIDPETGLEPYEVYNPITDTYHRVEPEYVNMSRRPGIGKEWYDKFQTDMHDGRLYITHSRDFASKKLKPVIVKNPVYFDKLRERENPELQKEIVDARKQKAIENAENHSYDRLRAKEVILRQRISQLKRNL